MGVEVKVNKGELTTEYRGDGRHCIIVRPLPACFRGWSVLCDVMSGLGGIWYLCYAGDLAVAGGSCYKAVLSCLFLFFFRTISIVANPSFDRSKAYRDTQRTENL